MSKSKIKIKKTKDEKNAIAIIRGGLYDGQYVSMEPYDNDNEQTLKINNLNDNVSNKTIKEYTPKYGMNLKHLFELEQAFKSVIAPNEYSSVKNTYDKIKPIVENKINNRIIINDGTFEIIPRLEKNLIFFDSYGNIIDDQIKKYYSKSLYQNIYYRNGKKRIVELFLKSKKYKNFEYNQIQLQKTGKIINTCGRHCICIIKTLHDTKCTLDEYLNFMKKIKDKDEYVTFYTNQLY